MWEWSTDLKLVLYILFAFILLILAEYSDIGVLCECCGSENSNGSECECDCEQVRESEIVFDSLCS
jgi:hypothetical protein